MGLQPLLGVLHTRSMTLVTPAGQRDTSPEVAVRTNPNI